MNSQTKTKDELIKELQELKQENSSLRELFEKERSENKITAKKLRASEEKFLSLFENQVAANLIIDPDNENIFDANEAAAQFYGWKVYELKTMRLSQINISPIEEINKIIQTIRIKQESYFETKHRKADGSIRDVSVNGSRVIIDGKVYHFVLINDITERKQLESVLEEKITLMENSQELARLGSYRIDIPSKTIFLSPEMAELYGADRMAISLPLEEYRKRFYFPEDFERGTKLADYAYGSGTPLYLESRVIRTDSKVIWIQTRSKTLPNGTTILGVVQDITDRKQAEEALKENVQRYLELFEMESDSILVFDNETGNILEANPNVNILYGYTSEELFTLRDKDLVADPEILRNNLDLMNSYTLDQIVKSFRVYHQKKDGTIFPVEITGRVFMKNGRKVRIVAIRDITEHILAEESLLKSERRFKDLFNLSPIAIALLDKQGHPFFSNAALSQMMGYSNSELSDMTFAEFTHPEDVEKDMSQFNALYEGKISEYNMEKRYVHKNGNIVWGNLWVTIRRDSNGNPEEIIGMAEDITERKKSEDALRKSEELYRNLVERLRDGVYRSTHAGKYVEVNSALVNMLGYESKEDLMNIDIKSELYLDPLDREKIILQEDLDGFDIFPLKKKDGTVIWCEDNGWYIRDDNGNIIFHEGIMRDITKRREAELLQQDSNKLIEVQNQKLITANNELIVAIEKAEESDRLKSVFLANMSHEIRTPMNGILGFAELLKDSKLSSEEQQEYISMIEKSGVRMLNIINDIVNISKIESGQMTVNITESNINEQIEYINSFFKPEVEQKGMQLFYKNALPSKESIINTDREKVFAILTNLVKNAIKYTDKGSIEFGYKRKGEYLEFFVNDTGIGIPQNRQEAIFERFIQADLDNKRAFQGAGLGLAITKNYVEMLGGKIWVESEEGKGSIFYFTLPFETTAIETIGSQKIVPATNNKILIKKLKTLIAEDNIISERLISIIAIQFSREVLSVKKGSAAVEACRNNPDIDLILMDIQMPEMDGYEATRQIRQFNKDIIIIAQTAFGLSGDREKAIEAGFNDYIAKPIKIDALKRLIIKHFKN